MPPTSLVRSVASARSTRLIAGAAAAALLLAGPAAQADAHAASRPAAGSHGSHGSGAHGSGAHAHDKLAGPRRGAAHAVAAQLKAVAALRTRAVAHGGPNADALTTALDADRAAIQADLDAVATASSVRALHALRSHAVGTRQIARTQYSGVLAADAAAAQSAALASSVSSLGAALAALPTGTDITAGQAALTDATAQLATVDADTTDVVGRLVALAPAASPRDVHGVLGAIRAEFVAMATALDAAATDVDQVRTAYSL